MPRFNFLPTDVIDFQAFPKSSGNSMRHVCDMTMNRQGGLPFPLGPCQLRFMATDKKPGDREAELEAAIEAITPGT
jgi:hypothetical protein